jgi:hypothetical protein
MLPNGGPAMTPCAYQGMRAAKREYSERRGGRAGVRFQFQLPVPPTVPPTPHTPLELGLSLYRTISNVHINSIIERSALWGSVWLRNPEYAGVQRHRSVLFSFESPAQHPAAHNSTPPPQPIRGQQAPAGRRTGSPTFPEPQLQDALHEVLDSSSPACGQVVGHELRPRLHPAGPQPTSLSLVECCGALWCSPCACELRRMAGWSVMRAAAVDLVAWDATRDGGLTVH